ncbi:MAG: EAL domain-containing protein [Kangiellaceae bacterium]
MTAKLLKFIFLFGLFGHSFAADKIVLQLKWEHEFQFAGYYAAQWQGYYKDAGLEVEIRSVASPDGKFINPMDEVKNGNAHFSIGGLDILIARDEGLDLVVLASFFQKTPNAVFSLNSTQINDLNDLSKLRISTSAFQNASVELKALLLSRGYDPEKVKFINEPITVDTLIAGKADAIVTYEISAMSRAKELAVNLNKLHPEDYGFAFYSDSLYSTYAFTQKNPELTQRFIAATKKGWEYALNHKQEIAKKIADLLPRYKIKYDDLYAYNLTFSEYIDSFMQYPEIPLGDVNFDRWFNMNEKIRSLGLVRSQLEPDKFIFSPQENTINSNQRRNYIIITLINLPLIFFFWYRRSAKLTIATIMLMALLIGHQIEVQLEKEIQAEERLHASEKLNAVTAKLQGNLQNSLSMLTGFAAYISATPDLSESDFDNYAHHLFKKDPLLVNFAAAKNLVVNYIYPKKGNEKAIGLDYKNNQAQKRMVMQVVKTGQMQVVGPVNLVQGGQAFIGRAPIYMRDGSLWGIISAPLKLQSLYRYSGLIDNGWQDLLAIRSYDAFGEEGPVFFGDSSIFESPERITKIIAVGAGTWHIAVKPPPVHGNASFSVFALRTFIFLTATIFSLFAWIRFKQDSEKRRLESKIREDKKLLESVGQVAKIGGWKLDKNLNIVQWSVQSSTLLAKAKNYVPKKLSDLEEILEPAEYQLWKNNSEIAFNTGEPFDIELKLNDHQPDSSQKNTTWLRIISSRNINVDTNHVTGTMQDVTDKVLSARLIEYQANFDKLTNLPNRVLYRDRLIKSIDIAKRNAQKIAVLFIDLDRFKPVNDNHGHQAGDQLLIEAAKRIQSCLRDSDTVSRLSGDEFAVILNGIPQYSHVLKVTEHIIETFQKPFQLDDLSVHSSASIGVSIYPDDADNADSLLRKADQAMYEVKATGRNGWQFYTREMQLKSEYRHELLNDLIFAINNQKLEPFFQPIYDLNSNRLVKCEALARWKNKGSYVSPFEFISLAEESGLINRIDLFMLQNSAQFLISNKVDVTLSINISPRLFHTKDKALENWMKNIVKLSERISIVVEITERLLTDESERALKVLTKLKNYGIKIAIDDFGTGYSSLSYLVKYPVDIIKIDQTFIKNIGIDASSEALIETVISMAKRLNLEVVAEGIETKEQLDYLKNKNCAFGQGYHLGKPMNKEDFQQII